MAEFLIGFAAGALAGYALRWLTSRQPRDTKGRFRRA